MVGLPKTLENDENVSKEPFINGECSISTNIYNIIYKLEHAVAQLVEALCYKSEGRGFDSRWCH